jgi:pyridoxamine 5'-phosphate oxidase
VRVGEAPGPPEALDPFLSEAWALLARGVADRRSAVHTPTLATLGLDGRPRARTVVLRGCEPGERRLRFHCDVRSDKFVELGAEPRLALHAYEPGRKLQLRVEGEATLHRADAVADAAWAGSRPMARVCYGSDPGPGAVIPEGGAYRLPDEAATEPGRSFFAAVLVTVARLEMLSLALRGHRRARFTWEGGRWVGEWLVP